MFEQRNPFTDFAESDGKNTDELANECIIDQEPRLEGRNMVMILSPKKQ